MKILPRSKCAILPLVLKKKWFDEIRLGGKREEYRACTPYWAIRLSNWDNTDATAHVVEFRLGYAKDAPRVAYNSPWYTSTDDCRHPEWGEPDGLHYIIFLGQPVILKGEP